MFAESEFEAACQELDTPDLNGWQFFTQSDSREINIFRRYNEKSGLYAYKIFGTMDVPVDICTQVYLDISYRSSWDPYLRDIKEISHSGRQGIYWQVIYPFPMWRRDLVFVRDTRKLNIDGREVNVILSKADSVLNDVEPVPKNTVRIRNSEQSIAITSHGPNSSKAFSYYYEDPGGLIPSWIINWAAKTGVPALLSATVKGCREYPEYLKRKNTGEVVVKANKAASSSLVAVGGR